MRLRALHRTLRSFWHHLRFWTFPTPPENYYSHLAAIAFEAGNYRKAISRLLASDKAQGHRDNALARYNSYYLGYSYVSLGNLREAAEHFERYFRLNPHDAQIASMLGSCYESMQKREGALEWYLRAVELAPDLPYLRIACSLILTELGRTEEARKQLETAEGPPQGSFEGQVIESLTKHSDGDLRGAVETLKEAVSGAPQDGGYLLLSRFQKEAGDLMGALTTLDAGLKTNPDDPWLIDELAMECADQGVRLAEALSLIDRALEQQPDNPIFLDTRAWILFKLGRKADAHAELGRCLELLPDYEEAREHRRVVLQRGDEVI